MKRWLLIIGIILTLLLAGIWVYLLLGGNPNGGGPQFSLFNFGDTTDPEVELTDTNNPPPELPVVDVEDSLPIRQLTTTPVVGYQEVQQGTSSAPLIYYVEAGTGHIFTINLETGEEQRVSNTTVPDVFSAQLSPAGTYAVLQIGNGTIGDLRVLTLPHVNNNFESSSFTIEEPVLSYQLIDNDRLVYAVRSTGSTVIKSFDLIERTTSTLFEIPYREVVMRWGTTTSGPHYSYPRGAKQLEGYLYRHQSGNTTRLGVSGYGLNALANDRYIVYSAGTDTELSLIDLETNEHLSLPKFALLDKCEFNKEDTSLLACGVSEISTGTELPDDWYSGKLQTSDQLTIIDLDDFSEDLIDIPTLVGRSVDMTGLKFNTNVLFRNKLDNTLWLYETDKQ